RIEVPYLAFNNASNLLKIKTTIRIWEGNELRYERDGGILGIAPGNSTGDLLIALPDNCALSSGNYDLELTTAFAQDGGNAPVNVSVFNDNSNILCDDLSIPTAGQSAPCQIFVADLAYADSGENCCTLDPEMTLSKFPNAPQSNPCRSMVSVAVDFDNGGDPVEYTILWSNGATTPTFEHNCGTREYDVTITWEQNGETCTKTAGPILVESICACDRPGKGTDPKLGGAVLNHPHSSSSVQKFSLFPNPNNGHFQLLIPRDQTLARLEVWNALGQQVLNTNGPLDQQHTVDLQNIKPGVHFVRIQYVDGHTDTQQFLVR
ncbi:MAG: T9SS type A sorting domain-containing protein, partial [Bacteroidota bacterium]